MKKAFIDTLFTENQIKYISEIIFKNNGVISDDSNESDLIILFHIEPNLLKKNEFSQTKANLFVSFNCIREMDKNGINPFDYKSENKVLQNIYFRQKTFTFKDVPHDKTRFYSMIITQLDGKIVQNNADFILAEKYIKDSPINTVFVDWIYAIQYSSVYINPDNFFLNRQKKFPVPLVNKTQRCLPVPQIKAFTKGKKSNQFC